MSERLDQHLRRLRPTVEAAALAIPWAAVELIARSEDCRTSAYLCPAGKPTIAWGETEGVRLGMVWSPSECDRRFVESLRERVAQVESLILEPTTPQQLGALVSLHYNIGHANFRRSTVLRQHNAGNTEAAARAFALWDKARDPRTGKLVTLRGLTARRAAERALYLTPADDSPADRVAQIVEPESPIAASPIARGGAATVGAGVVTAATTLADQVDTTTGTLAAVKAAATAAVDFLGLPPGALLAAALIIAGYYVLKWRRKQRTDGWA